MKFRTAVPGVEMDIDPERYASSRSWKRRADAVIPVGTQTFSKASSSFVSGATPLYLERGEGSHVVDVDGNEYVDYMMGLGPVTIGYGDDRVDSAVTDQLRDGVLLSLPHPREVELSETLRDLIPAAEMVRFGKNGSDVTSAAVRLARAYTGRDTIAFCGYHGWQDWYVAATTRDRGVPASIKPYSQKFEYNDLDGLREVFDEHDPAAVIMEPMNSEPPEEGFLEGVRELAHDNDALLIFDEIITGFRFSLGGAQEYFDVTPDLACFGKGMANGFPIAALVGREDVMCELEDVFFSFTFGGELASIAAAQATIDAMQRDGVIEHMWDVGGRLKDGVDELVREHGLSGRATVGGLAPWAILGFEADDDEGDLDLALKSLFQQEVVNRGVLFNGNHFICDHHTGEDVEATFDAYDAAFAEVADALDAGDVRDRLAGEMIRPVFRREKATTGEDV